jgi:hypothetical protein
MRIERGRAHASEKTSQVGLGCRDVSRTRRFLRRCTETPSVPRSSPQPDVVSCWRSSLVGLEPAPSVALRGGKARGAQLLRVGRLRRARFGAATLLTSAVPSVRLPLLRRFPPLRAPAGADRRNSSPGDQLRTRARAGRRRLNRGNHRDRSEAMPRVAAVKRARRPPSLQIRGAARSPPEHARGRSGLTAESETTASTTSHPVGLDQRRTDGCLRTAA